MSEADIRGSLQRPLPNSQYNNMANIADKIHYLWPRWSFNLVASLCTLFPYKILRWDHLN